MRGDGDVACSEDISGSGQAVLEALGLKVANRLRPFGLGLSLDLGEEVVEVIGDSEGSCGSRGWRSEFAGGLS